HFEQYYQLFPPPRTGRYDLEPILIKTFTRGKNGGPPTYKLKDIQTIGSVSPSIMWFVSLL
ncbi:MAG: hypothetical protein KKD56_07485, partial [Acidobacteria bacterium]|nr:hypothetical protein [Acidobacteriota bacterium]